MTLIFIPKLSRFTVKKLITLSTITLLTFFLVQSSPILAFNTVERASSFNGIELKKSKSYNLLIKAVKSNVCKVEITHFTGQSITVEFSGLPANQSSTYKNFIAVWEASVIPWTVEPLKKVDIGINVQSGTLTIDNLAITYNSYVAAYGVGFEISDICASAVLNPNGSKAALSNVNMEIKNLGKTSLSIHYKTLSGYQPKKNGNWIGLWEGDVSPYNLPPENVYTKTIDSYSNEGIVALNNISLGRHTTYTLIYFMRSENTSAAVILTFNTSDPTSDE